MAGITNLKGISTIFNKFTIDSEDKILKELIRLYITNPYRKKISISDLIQSSSLSNSNLTI